MEFVKQPEKQIPVYSKTEVLVVGAGPARAAAALSAKLGVTPRDLDVKALQKVLLGQGALLFLEDEKAREKETLTYAAVA